ncbi:glycosyltransferase [Pilimelia columellifera]|uniref:Glycosyltransferase family A protein n=1 Tax=Pilimelia columellifera subsp. columellifera TaxID=706583 RepID=A0ABN3NK12_9ACTN
MSVPTVGVVVPTRDRPELLRRTLAAIGAQDYVGPVRVVVVHDQSTPDHSAAAGALPTLVLGNSRTPGLAGARNTGIAALDTDLVAFCDDDDVWTPDKLSRQVAMLSTRPDALVASCAIEVEFRDAVITRLAGTDTVTVADLSRSRMAMLHSSTLLLRRAAMLSGGAIGPVAEDAPGGQNEDWDLLLRAARRAPIAHLDAPLVRVLWGRTSQFAYEYQSKIASLRWMLDRHPEIAASRPGAARVYGQLACWCAAAGDRRAAWRWTRRAVGRRWREPRAAIAVAAIAGVPVERVVTALHRRGRGI